MAKKARELKKAAEALHQEERNGKKDRKWRKNVKSVEKASFQFFLYQQPFGIKFLVLVLGCESNISSLRRNCFFWKMI